MVGRVAAASAGLMTVCVTVTWSVRALMGGRYQEHLRAAGDQVTTPYLKERRPLGRDRKRHGRPFMRARTRHLRRDLQVPCPPRSARRRESSSVCRRRRARQDRDRALSSSTRPPSRRTPRAGARRAPPASRAGRARSCRRTPRRTSSSRWATIVERGWPRSPRSRARPARCRPPWRIRPSPHRCPCPGWRRLSRVLGHEAALPERRGRQAASRAVAHVRRSERQAARRYRGSASAGTEWNGFRRRPAGQRRCGPSTWKASCSVSSTA